MSEKYLFLEHNHTNYNFKQTCGKIEILHKANF